jgi:hypothetical protein
VASASLAPLAQLVIRVRNSDAFSIDPARDYRSRAGFFIFSGELCRGDRRVRAEQSCRHIDHS